MQSSSPIHFPSSPSPAYQSLTHKPLNSSPLASPTSSNTAQARRRLSYKSRVPSTPTPSRSFTSHDLFSSTTKSSNPQKNFLRERFKARCVERAVKAREAAVRNRRWSESDASSDGFDLDCEDDEMEEDDDAVMQDELFRRIIENANRKTRYSYRLSYQDEVGSSIDPDMEDVGRWECELRQADRGQHPGTSALIPTQTPEDLEAEELAAYAEEYAALADLEDLDAVVDELFSYSDIEDEQRQQNGNKTGKVISPPADDDDMDMTG